MSSIQSALLHAATSNGFGPTLDPEVLRDPRKVVNTVYVWGVFGGASVSISISPDSGVTWFPAGPASITVQQFFNLGVSALAIRAQVSGATGTTSLFCSIL